jgi:aspartyl protease family protein
VTERAAGGPPRVSPLRLMGLGAVLSASCALATGQPAANRIGGDLPSAPAPAPAAARAADAGLAPTVAYSGRLGKRALLVIDGQPRTLAVGESAEGVRLLALRDDDSADVQIAGRRARLRLGAAPVALVAGAQATPAALAAGHRVVLEADTGGHFVSDGSINGNSTRFMVDTGATLVALSQTEADRLGIAFRDAPRGTAATANGEVPVHRVRLASVRVGSLEVPMVDAVVLPAAMPHVLLGNSFLGRVRMNRDGERMTLERRP